MVPVALALQILTSQVVHPPGAGQPDERLAPCDVWKPLGPQIENLIQTDAQEDILASLVAVEKNVLGQVEAALRKCENLAGVQHQICENHVATSQLPDCASLGVQQRRDRVACTRRLPGGAQAAPPPVDETAIDNCFSAKMNQLGRENSAEAQQVIDWLASHATAKADMEAKARQADQEADDSRRAWAKLLKDHPELPAEAISAVICRVEEYRKWVVGQIDRDKRYSRVGGAVNLTKRYGLQQLLRFLDNKKADATAALRARFHARPLACSSSPVKALATCVVPPVLLGQDEEPLAPDPEQTCAYHGPHIDWFTSDKPEDPSVYWYLGSDWFQPTALADGEN